MTGALLRCAQRAAVAVWLAGSENSFRRWVVANDSPHVHAPGVNPDRLLIAGDGASAGVGVRTHELGLPGYLARSVSRLTGRATDADIVVTTEMTAHECRHAISALQLARFDVIILSLGENEALELMSPRRWSADMTRLLDSIEQSAPASTQRIMLSIPYFGPTTRMPRFLSAPVNRRAERLNRITMQIVAERPNVAYLAFAPGEGTEPEGAHSYAEWADHLAPAVSAHLAPRGTRRRHTENIEEAARQRALDELALVNLAADDELDRITRSARDLFGVHIAAVTLIDTDQQLMASVAGAPRPAVPRSQSFCDVTIRRGDSLAIEDAQRDPRYANFEVVKGGPNIRFYAGYPIESPNGHRIGALCLMDPRPRRFTDRDSALLRQIAHQVQLRLWSLSGPGSAAQGT